MNILYVIYDIFSDARWLPRSPVDLVTDKVLREELRPSVERDAVHV